MRLFRWLLLLLGIGVLAADVYFAQHGKHFCPYEGCKIVASTPFSVLLGYPLTFWGLAFFLGAFLFSFFEPLFALWISLGTGFSLYMIYLQYGVIGKLCQLCLLVEGIVLVLFITSLRSKRFSSLLFFVLIGFLGTHFLYTFPPDYVDSRVEKAATWKGQGEYEVSFFFDPLCPACGKTFELLKKKEEFLKEIKFKSLAIHKGSFERARAFYDECLKGKEPWSAFELIHRKDFSYSKYEVPVAKVKGIVKRNLDAILAFGLNAVPVLVVHNSDRHKILVGYGSISQWLDSLSKRVESLPVFQPIEGEVCTPQRECQ
ncbi:vitamin K epoxide reductase family protein [Thermosulfidibacter takaii]|nr:vitamin K epoxide reductase family protein [Thermosulfidibacter takaii]